MTTTAGDPIPYTSRSYNNQPDYIVMPAAPDPYIREKLDKILDLLRRRSARKCYICNRESEFWETLPYGSFYADVAICGDCCAKYIDPILDLVRKAKGGWRDRLCRTVGG